MQKELYICVLFVTIAYYVVQAKQLSDSEFVVLLIILLFLLFLVTSMEHVENFTGSEEYKDKLNKIILRLKVNGKKAAGKIKDGTVKRYIITKSSSIMSQAKAFIKPNK